MSRDSKPGDVVDIRSATGKTDDRREERREAKARDLKKRFSAARSAAESKSTAAERLKRLFKNPPKKP